MMIRIILLSLFVCIQKFGFSQSVLDYNSVSALLLDDGTLFNDPNTNVPGYEVPKGSGKSTIYVASFWAAGIDQFGTLRNACTRYNSGRDYFSGPVSSSNSYTDPNYISNYDSSMWTVYKTEIDFHIANYSQVGYVCPPNILNWPGNGILSLGIAHNLAPFVDMNNNGLYEPNSGDYPDIRGDLATYIIMNDIAGPHTETGGLPMGIEMHVMAFQTTANNFLDSTTFLNVRVFNRGIYTYNNFKLGLYVDADLGGYSDDYVGCDSSRNLMYSYNGDNDDAGVNGYGLNPPAIGVVSINHEMNYFGYYTSSMSYPYSDPSTASQFWNYMNGSWANGDAWYYGGLGFTGSVGVSTTPTNYMFSGNPYTGTGWSEVTNSNPPGDRRMFMVTDSVDLATTGTECFDLAVVYSRKGNHLENVQGVIDLADSVEQFFLSQPFNCNQVTVGVNENHLNDFEIFPNPNKGTFVLRSEENIDQIEFEIVDLRGKNVQFEKVKGHQQIEIKLNEKPGLYFIKITKEGQIQTEKIIIE